MFDGVGGRARGEVASAEATELVWEWVKREEPLLREAVAQSPISEDMIGRLGAMIRGAVQKAYVVRSLLAAVRKAARIPDDDPRTLPVLLHDLLQQRLDHMVRAEKAEQGLHRVLNHLAGSAAKIAALEQEVTTLKTELEDQEVELWMSAAEISLRRSRMLRPDQSEVDAYRRAGAADARRAQQQRRESGREK